MKVTFVHTEIFEVRGTWEGHPVNVRKKVLHFQQLHSRLALDEQLLPMSTGRTSTELLQSLQALIDLIMNDDELRLSEHTLAFTTSSLPRIWRAKKRKTWDIVVTEFDVIDSSSWSVRLLTKNHDFSHHLDAVGDEATLVTRESEFEVRVYQVSRGVFGTTKKEFDRCCIPFDATFKKYQNDHLRVRFHCAEELEVCEARPRRSIEVLPVRVAPGDLLFFNVGNRAITTAFRWLTWSNWDHVGLVVRVDGELRLLEAVGEGVLLKNLEDELFTYARACNAMGIRRVIPHQHAEQQVRWERQLAEFAKEIEGGQYSLISFNCATLVSKAYQRLGQMPESTLVHPASWECPVDVPWLDRLISFHPN